jgi:predicted neutral ceramidase superfamily lipid hydrolase
MTNPVKMAVFMIVATLFNIAVTAVCFFVLYFAYIILILPHAPNSFAAGFTILFIAALALAFIIYRKVLKLYLKKYPMPEMDKEPAKES